MGSVWSSTYAGSRRYQEDGGGAGPSSYRVQARPRGGRWCWTLKLQGPGELKRREVVLDPQVTGSRRAQEEGGGAGPSRYRVQARSRGGRWCWAFKLQGPGETKRREVMLDPVVSPEESMSREVELGCESWTFFAASCYSTAVQRTLSL